MTSEDAKHDGAPMIASIPTLGKRHREKALKAFQEQSGNVVPTFTELSNDFEHLLEDIHDSFPAIDVKAVDVAVSYTHLTLPTNREV